MSQNSSPARHCRLYQVASPGLDCFHLPFDAMQEKYANPPPGQYQLVFDGEVTFSILEDVFYQFNVDPPRIHDYLGHSMMVSDIFEIIMDGQSQFFYCDVFGFAHVEFDASQVAKA